jgi:hypothetical protein
LPQVALTTLPTPTQIPYATANPQANQTHNTTSNYYNLLAEDDDYAILDSGASDNYGKETAPSEKKTAKHDQISVTVPNGATMKSSHLTVFPIPNLPTKAKEGYIIPGLNKNLISVTKLCDHGCKVLFSSNECIVMHNNVEVIRGERSKSNGLWYIPLTKVHGAHNITIVDDTKANLHEGNSAFHTSTMAETITFLHQCLFSPTIDTLCKAIDNDQLIGFPRITSALVRKYLPESTATAKGHMNRTRKGIRSTTRQKNQQRN